jgi:hypothetical protein
MLKCSRCSHIFPAERTQRDRDRAPRAAAPRPAPPPPGREPNLEFDDTAWGDEQPQLPSASDDEYSLGTEVPAHGRRRAETPRPSGPTLFAPAPSSRDAAPSAPGLGPATPRDGDAAGYTFDEEPFVDEPDADLSQADDAEQLSLSAVAAGVLPVSFGADDEGDDAEPEDDDPEEEDDDEEPYTYDEPGEDEPVKAPRRSVLPLLLLFAIVAGGYFLLAEELIRNRELAESFVARLPLIGSSLAADRLLFRKVALHDVEGQYVRVKNGKDVFVVSGTALNTASRPLRNIRVEGALLDQSGRALHRETITCGGVDARRLLQGLSLREVQMLGKVEPSRRFRLDPGETTSFAIVFADPPADARDFTARVASAQR